MKITDLLAEGQDNAIPGRDLAKYLECDLRTVCAMVEQARRGGAPICAMPTGANAGYYLAADDNELRDYCSRLEHRENELKTTRGALIKILEQISNQKEIETNGTKNTN